MYHSVVIFPGQRIFRSPPGHGSQGKMGIVTSGGEAAFITGQGLSGLTMVG
jgi:hypothetical protein